MSWKEDWFVMIILSALTLGLLMLATAMIVALFWGDQLCVS